PSLVELATSSLVEGGSHSNVSRCGGVSTSRHARSRSACSASTCSGEKGCALSRVSHSRAARASAMTQRAGKWHTHTQVLADSAVWPALPTTVTAQRRRYCSSVSGKYQHSSARPDERRQETECGMS